MRSLVIGGSSSVGRRVVAALARRGDEVLATFADTKMHAQDGIGWTRLDLLRPEAVEAFARETATRFGPIDVAVFLAGILPGMSLEEYSFEALRRVVDINFTAQARLVQLLLPAMARSSQFLMMSSVAAERGSYDPVYAASKAALIGFIKSMAVSNGGSVRFNGIAPGLIDGSKMQAAMAEHTQRRHLERSPTGELLGLEDVARVIVDLTEPHWRQLNGAIIRLNGGSYV